METNFYNTPGKYPGIFGWMFTTDHKRIGLLYLGSTFAFFLVGVCLGLTMRLELIRSGMHLFSAQTYNALFTVHGVIMIFLFIIPGIPASLGNFILPIQIGARDVAFPRLNLLSWWLYIIGAASCRHLALHRRRPARHRLDLLRPLQRPHRHQRLAGGLRRLPHRLLLDPHRASTSSPPSTGCGRRA